MLQKPTNPIPSDSDVIIDIALNKRHNSHGGIFVWLFAKRTFMQNVGIVRYSKGKMSDSKSENKQAYDARVIAQPDHMPLKEDATVQ